MTTRDLFFPELASAQRGARNAESPNAEREAGSAEWADSALPDDFASMMDRALDGEPPRGSGLESTNAELGSAELEDEASSDTVPDSGPSSAVSVGDALAPNIIILPPPSVIIPFPVAPDHCGSGIADCGIGGDALHPNSAIRNPQSAVRNSSDLTLPDGGFDVARLKMLPVETDDSAPDNIQIIDFRQPAEAKIIRLPLAGPLSAERGARNAESDSSALPGAPVLLEGSEEAAPSQLPGGEGSREEIAHLHPTDRPGVGPPENSKGVAKAIAHGGLPRVYVAADSSAEATGISAARQESRMDSMKNSEPGNAFAGRGQEGPEEFPPASRESARAELKPADISSRISGAMDWQLGRPVGSLDRPSPVSAAPLTPEQSATVDRIAGLISRETSLVRQYSSDSMAVVLRPDDSTELYVHFAQRNGQIEATIRCDRGDAQQLGALWPQLQESLAQQRVRLAPLQEGPSANDVARAPTSAAKSRP